MTKVYIYFFIFAEMATRIKQIADLDSLRRVLKSHSLKATPQRLAVHEAMMALGHAGVDLIESYIGAHSDVRITPASIYNILTQFSKLGLYTQRMSMGSKMVFDVNNTRHIHLYDSRTDEMTDIMDDELLAVIEGHLRKRRFKGYKIDRAELSLVCHPTRKKTAKL